MLTDTGDSVERERATPRSICGEKETKKRNPNLSQKSKPKPKAEQHNTTKPIWILSSISHTLFVLSTLISTKRKREREREDLFE